MSGAQPSGLPSIHVLVPLEEGGSIARTGFAYQDHVAAGYCIQMLRNPDLQEVWCETEDDITLLWKGSPGVEVEFVQVKSDDPLQLWSVALLCAEGAKSIAAKSLAHDRCEEPCRFRILTRCSVNKDLRVLQRPLDDPERGLCKPSMLELHKEVCMRLGDVQSARGRSISHWLAEMVWEVAESAKALEQRNLAELDEYLEGIGQPLFSDQRRDLYDRLLRRVQQASFPTWAEGGAKKKVQRQFLSQWLLGQLNAVKGIATGKAGQVMRGKMNDANIPGGTIETADDLRREQRRRDIDPKYLTDPQARLAEQEAIASLNELLAQLGSGALQESGSQFHARCLAALSQIRAVHPAVQLSLLQGVMYVATERCRHRFKAAAL
jgi:hypothetical protein